MGVAAQPRTAARMETEGGWCASLSLTFARRSGRTVCLSPRHEGPLRVQRPFYPEGSCVCHTYLLHPPGGIVCGDTLDVDVRMQAGAHALVTTPGAAKFYRGFGRARAVQQHNLSVADGSVLEWFPQETIVFNGAEAAVNTRVSLQEAGTFIGWDILCLGRPAAQETFAAGEFINRLEVQRDGEHVLVERARYSGAEDVLTCPSALANSPVVGTLVYVGAGACQVEPVREACTTEADHLFSVTRTDGALICRYLGASTDQARGRFLTAWDCIRRQVLGKPAVAPRIWNT